MTDSGAKLKVGLTFLLAFAILLIGILWLDEYHPGSKVATIRAAFEDSGGIRPGDPVEVAGVRAGKILDVSLTSGNIALVRFTLSQSVQLHPDAVFQVHDVGIMGDKVLRVNPGAAPGVLNLSGVQRGAPAVGIDTAVSDAHEVLLRLKNVTAKVDSGLNMAQLTGAFEETLGKVQQLAAVFRTIAEENRVPLHTTMHNMTIASSDLQRFIAANDTSAGRAIESFQRTSDRLSLFIESLQPLSAVTDTLAASMKSGNGTFAHLVRSEEFYDELRHTNAAIDSFLTDFKRNPGKYTKNMKFRISLF